MSNASGRWGITFDRRILDKRVGILAVSSFLGTATLRVSRTVGLYRPEPVRMGRSNAWITSELPLSILFARREITIQSNDLPGSAVFEQPKPNGPAHTEVRPARDDLIVPFHGYSRRSRSVRRD